MKDHEKINLRMPTPFGPRFYRAVAQEFSGGCVPIIRGSNAYYHLGKVREYVKDNLVILQIHPRSVEEVNGFVKQLTREGKNVAVVDPRWIRGNYTNPFGTDDFYKKDKFKILDFGLAEAMNGYSPEHRQLPDEIYNDFISMLTVKYEIGVLEGTNVEYHLERMKKMTKGKLKVAVDRVPPLTPQQVIENASKRNVKTIALDSREETGQDDWPDCYRTDIDSLLYLKAMQRAF